MGTASEFLILFDYGIEPVVVDFKIKYIELRTTCEDMVSFLVFSAEKKSQIQNSQSPNPFGTFRPISFLKSAATSPKNDLARHDLPGISWHGEARG